MCAAKTEQDLRQELDEQISALKASMDSYDSGTLWEAKRLAATMYILLHDAIRGKSKSLLGQLGLKSAMRFPSSVIPDMPHPPWGGELIRGADRIVSIEISPDGSATYRPLLDAFPQDCWLTFQQWWEEPVFFPFGMKPLTRKNFIFSVRDQDGGSHVDPVLQDEVYSYIKIEGDPISGGIAVGNFKGIAISAEGVRPEGSSKISNAVGANVRQIAHEVHIAVKTALQSNN